MYGAKSVFQNILLCALTIRNVISLNISSFNKEKGIHPWQTYRRIKKVNVSGFLPMCRVVFG